MDQPRVLVRAVDLGFREAVVVVHAVGEAPRSSDAADCLSWLDASPDPVFLPWSRSLLHVARMDSLRSKPNPMRQLSVAARKDDVAAVDQAATAKLAVSVSAGCDGGLIHPTSG